MLNFYCHSVFECPLFCILVQLSGRTLLTKRSYFFILISKAFPNSRHSRGAITKETGWDEKSQPVLDCLKTPFLDLNWSFLLTSKQRLACSF
ncbi:hypothetical protein CLOSTMETH_03237 [[Clostridium] methylpentosum DSM 5476]|uniref:Uncharacterized protein n=1 Tax=[Clostridium] methylpentosum DSM 5476 TaxID=537013 RepID=C0EH37_9FIRM|nr:hypothetical protein CLOSTMETH_03237 [[Clostridium] methylpentosum DSM 5476]